MMTTRASHHQYFVLSSKHSLKDMISKPLYKKVEDIGVEPMTSCVQGRRSSQLS